MNPTARKEVLVVGNVEHPEFRTSIAWLQSVAEARVVLTNEEGLQYCGRHSPDFIVLVHSRPGEMTAAEVERLHAAAPLSRIVGLLGSWCDGESRTGKPWPGVARVYWHQFVDRFGRDWLGGSASLATAPRTLTDAERTLRRPQAVNRSGMVVIRSLDRLSYESLSDSLSVCGYATARVSLAPRSETHGAVAGIWECCRGVDEEAREMARFVESLAPAAILALVSFPRQRDVLAARDSGVQAVVAKPFVVADLIARLDRIVRDSSPSRPPAWHIRRHVQRDEASIE
jgi:hypothetical protein